MISVAMVVKPRPRYNWVHSTPPEEPDFGEDMTRGNYLLYQLRCHAYDLLHEFAPIRASSSAS
jgi:hypothetical protein